MLSKIYENLSNELISQRKLLGVSQQELATLVGTSKRSISTYEKNCYRGATIATVMRIAEVLERRRQDAIDNLRTK